MLATENLLEEIESLGSAEREFIRDTARNDLYTLSKGILGRPDVTVRTHLEFCRFFDRPLERADGSLILRRLGLMPRGHLKSTVATVDDSLRLVLKDPNNTKVLIANETARLATTFLGFIRSHWEKNRVLRALFPELVPTRFSGPGVTWGSEMATIVRDHDPGGPSWMALGVGAASVGFHYTHIKCDDLIGFDAAKYPAKMQFALDWNENIESLLVDQNVDVIDWIGTRWKKNDLYNHIMKQYGDSLAVFTREAIEDGQIIFPEKHNWTEYQRLMVNTPMIWAAQYRNNPMAAERQDFVASAVKLAKLSLDGEKVILNPGLRSMKVWRLAQLDVVVLVDPNSGDPLAPDTAAIITTGVTPDDDIVVLDAWSDRISPTELVDKIYEKARRWRARVVGIEKAGQQTTAHYFRKKAESEGAIQVEDLRPENTDKPTRIRLNLDPIIRSGRLYLMPDQQVLMGQINDFPDLLIWDELDALAYGPQLWRKPYTESQIKKNRASLKLILSRRNPITGY